MNPSQVELTGTLQADGTVVLDQRPALPPGRVRLVMQPVADSAPPHEGWWNVLQRIRAEREAAGYSFLNEQQMAEHLDWLHDDDDRIDRIHREMEQERRRQESH